MAGGVGEAGLVELFSGVGPAPGPGVVAGIGDDCAILRPEAGAHLVVSTDMLVERVHFDLSWTPPRALGWKSLAVNLSDLAAMGASPGSFYLSVGLGPGHGLEVVEGFARGLDSCAREYGIPLLGGDTVASPGGMVISITVLGSAPAPLTRAGLVPGDLLYLGGPVGASAAGLGLLQAGLAGETRVPEGLIRAHLTPEPQLRLGEVLARSPGVHGCMDVSDGLLKDLGRMCHASEVGATVMAERLPIPDGVYEAARALGLDPLELGLSGGEDYVLLFGVARGEALPLEAEIERLGLPRIHRIGVVEAERGLRLQEGGVVRPIEPAGFDHFA